MKSCARVVSASLPGIFLFAVTLADPNGAGFFLPDSVQEMTIRYRQERNLIILPVRVNGTINVNLILDTGCRNLVLFGKRYQQLLHSDPDKKIYFSGFGDGKPVIGSLSLNNRVSIESVSGSQVPIIVVPDKNLFSDLADVDGIIGYEIFLRFEIEINPSARTITFRPAQSAEPRPGYHTVALDIVDSRPMMSSAEFYLRNKKQSFDLMIDTGSSIGILFQTRNAHLLAGAQPQSAVGIGLNGLFMGYAAILRNLNLGGFIIDKVSAGIVESSRGDHASIGMDILKNYILVLNYCKSYAAFRSL